MKKIVVASKNPVKMAAALAGFQAMFPHEQFEIEGVMVPSGVSDQPHSDAETLRGALNRAETAYQREPLADFWVGLEGGVEEQYDGVMAFAWAVVKSQTLIGKGKTGSFFLPPAVVELLKAGKELGEADDIVFQRANSKQQNGAVGILTSDVITRTEYYKAAVILALIPVRNPELYR
ncbi:MAG TPA: inosine/xanthosine triphosphatase [Ktedonosporobacter sp.]|nr:inosine/xanthosine triphosphatase [Ktedonosporobacter sp.]